VNVHFPVQYAARSSLERETLTLREVELRLTLTSDLLKRHASRHEAGPSQSAGARPGSDRLFRVSKACKACATSKLRCDEDTPCQRCVKKSLTCDREASSALERNEGTAVFAPVGGRPSTSSSVSTAEPEQSIFADVLYPSPSDSLSASNLGALGPESGNSDIAAASTAVMLGTQAPTIEPYFDETSGWLGPIDSMITDDTASGSWSNNDVLYTDFLKDMLFMPNHYSASEPEMSQGPTAHDVWDEFMASDLDLAGFNDFAFECLRETDPVLQYRTAIDHPAEVPSPEQAASAAGAQAFRSSVWNWTPEAHDTSYAEQTTLSRRPRVVTAKSDFLQYGPNSSDHYPSFVDRQRVVTAILPFCGKHHAARIAASFPTPDQNERAVRMFLHWQTVGTLSWFHVPTFQASSLRAELLAAIIAYGASMSPARAWQSFGVAMTDVVMAAIVHQWHTNNALTRDLQFLQGYALIQHLRFWSGNTRKMEIGESLNQPLVTVLRRAGMLRADHYRGIVVTDLEAGDVLQARWKAWVQQETGVRLVHHTLIHDAQASMSQFMSPLLCATEMNLPLPAPEELWKAVSAEQWKTVYLGLSETEPVRPSLAHCVRSALQQRPIPTHRDVGRYTLYGLWSMIWQEQQVCLLMQSDPSGRDASRSRFGGRQELLTDVLQTLSTDFVTHCGQLGNNSADAETKLILEYLQLVLRTPLQSLPTFAGKEGIDAAQQVYPSLQDWALNREGRQAMWHAGQVYRAARGCAAPSMRNFICVAVYHASLVFWTYGIIVGAQRLRAGRNLSENAQAFDSTVEQSHAFLDGKWSLEADRFVRLGDSSPVIGLSAADLSQSCIALHKVGAVMAVGVQILDRQADGGESTQFVESLTNLMSDLAGGAGAIGFS